MNSLSNQEALIYSLERTYSEMLRSGRRTRPGKYPVLQETVLGWTLCGRTPATSTKNDPQHTFLLRQDNSLEHNLNRSWEVEAVK